MQAINKINALAAHLDIMNVDTDMIIPKQFLKTIKKTGLGKYLFYELRYTEKDGKQVDIDDFVLNKPPFDKAQILITGSNFGCGSSREHAVWSLLDFGIRVVISESFAEIFNNNCLNNGILPIVLSKDEIARLAKFSSQAKNYEDESRKIFVNLEDNLIVFGNESIKFEIDPLAKHNLINGLDDIALTLNKLDKIADYEKTSRLQQPWRFIKAI